MTDLLKSLQNILAAHCCIIPGHCAHLLLNPYDGNSPCHSSYNEAVSAYSTISGRIGQCP